MGCLQFVLVLRKMFGNQFLGLTLEFVFVLKDLELILVVLRHAPYLLQFSSLSWYCLTTVSI